MAVPKFYEFFEAFLKACSDGQPHKSKEVKAYIAKTMKISEEDLAEMLPSNRQSTFANRVAWARTYLDRAGLIETPSRGLYRITEEGLKALSSGDRIDLEFMDRYPTFKAFHDAAHGDLDLSKKPDKGEEEEEKSPAEILDDAFKKVNATLAGELMAEVMKLTPGEFEKLVVGLLLKMGYGSGIDNAGYVTKLSGDGGIDGTIKEDQLGFSNIYIQAKQWDPESTVSKPEIQKFAGALMVKHATKGLFITTAKFSSGAREYVHDLHSSNIVLVDGDALMRLMIRFNLGVSVVQVYEVKRIDSDFFNDSL